MFSDMFCCSVDVNADVELLELCAHKFEASNKPSSLI